MSHLPWCLNTNLTNIWITYFGAWILSLQTCESLTLVPEYWAYKSVNRLFGAWILSLQICESFSLVPEYWAYKSVNRLHWCLNTELTNMWITYIGAWTLSLQICESLTLVPEYWAYKSVNHLHWCLNTNLKNMWITYFGVWILRLQTCELLTLVPEYWRRYQQWHRLRWRADVWNVTVSLRSSDYRSLDHWPYARRRNVCRPEFPFSCDLTSRTLRQLAPVTRTTVISTREAMYV